MMRRAGNWREAMQAMPVVAMRPLDFLALETAFPLID